MEMVHPQQSVFGRMGDKKKKKKKHKRKQSDQSRSSHQQEHDEEQSHRPENENDAARDNGEIRFVFPRAKSKRPGKLVPYLFEKQLDKPIDGQDMEEVANKVESDKVDQRTDESIDDILFSGKKKKNEQPSKSLQRDDTKSPHHELTNNHAIDTTKKSTQSELEESPRKINARSVQDAVRDKIGRRPRANSTDGELNLPRHGLCDEHIILESHKWDILRLYNNNRSALHNPPPPRGMVNLGNTCFLNATLQCLLYMPSFCHSITSLPASCYDSNGGGKHVRGQKITMSLRNLSRIAHGITAMEKHEPPKTKAIAPKAIVNAITTFKTGGHRFRPGRQEDAHELLVHLLDAMHEGELFAAGINPHSSGWRDRLPIPRLDETTFVHRIFGGYFRSQLRCKCGYKSNTYDPFLDLALEVSKKHIHSIETAFDEFTRKEKLDSDNRWKCSGCNKHVCPTKHLSVFRPPLSLCVHLKRFDFGGFGFGRGGWGGGYGHRHSKGLSMTGGGGSKINKPMQFPAQLNLPLSDSRVCEYNLTGIIVHVGNSATSGHYTAFVKKPGDSKTKTWYHMDDSFVETVSEKMVLKQHDVYVLFYSRKEVKLEFPQPPREPALKNGVKHDANHADVNGIMPHGSPSLKQKKCKGDKIKIPVNNDSRSAPQDAIKTTTASDKSSDHIATKQASSRSLKFESSSSVDEAYSLTHKSTSTTSPRSDSSAIKHAHEADSHSSTSESESSDSVPASSKQNHLTNIKKSLEYASKEQTAHSSEKKKPSKSVKVMKSNNVEVVLSRKKKRAWKPQEATKVNSEKTNVLLGNISVGGWNDDDIVEVQVPKPQKSKKDLRDVSLRDMATQAMQSADRSRKRSMHLDKWDAALDEGRVSNHTMF